MTQNPDVVVVGAGLAGCEAALQLANRGFKVRLYEQKPITRSKASKSDKFAELVCSNSFRAKTPLNAVGQLKIEMARLGSYFIAAGYDTEVAAGGALAVDRELFSDWLTSRILSNPNIEVLPAVLDDIPTEGREVILATGPLTGGKLSEKISELVGDNELHFYDAIAPVIDADSIDLSVAYFASRYDKGGADYLNLPLEKDEYYEFVKALVDAEKVEPKSFEKPKYFEGCLPIDLMAARGPKTLAFGPLKPVGLINPRTGKRPYGVVQLRAENADKSAFSLVGFQTRLTYPEQKRVLRTLPGLKNAELLRFGSVHRNTFINAPKLLDWNMRLLVNSRISIAGQLSGVEGYVESAASGLIVALMTARRLQGKPLFLPSEETMLGALMNYLLKEQKHFQPSNVTHAMISPLETRPRSKKDRKQAVTDRADTSFDSWIKMNNIEVLDPV